ncbi:Inactivated superfamily I helicase [Bordetella ansorpii]|uniref:Inactivated superfamily I helicase n=1 Tax=Bordetella ansorpii TaxID=288768 RepID=A0A157S6T5_9BORD|nr:PD-(D/E)XK nuclease family protein [Bordetella ansorpii]SAI65626.1 Inactivated superfamily I helicase [Bordetella ansorpii]
MIHDPSARAAIGLDETAALPAADTLVLTVNNRLARRLVLDLAGLLRRDRQVSELPRVMPLSAWLGEAADELAFVDGAVLPAYRLDAFAAQMMWVDAIDHEEAGRVLLDTVQAARLAADADALMDEWRLQVPQGADTDEYRGFSRWRARYRQRLDEIDAEDASRIYERVLSALQDGSLPAPPHVVLAGFTEVSPRFEALLSALLAGGSRLLWLSDARRDAATPSRFGAHDRGAQWRGAAAWAAQRLSEHPGGRYAIVSAQLEDESPFARRVLGRALAPGGFAFNVAVGRPLSEWPAVRAALAWLEALARMDEADGAETAVMGAALLAGHCAGDAREAAWHAGADARWRRNGVPMLSQSRWLRDMAGSALAEAWPRAMEAWRAVPGGKGFATTDAWMPVMRAALGALGYPGERALDSVGYQVVGAFGELLGRFGALAPAAGRLGAMAAVRLLARAADATTFQPQRDPMARLDVLGLLEAEGGSWDGIWILGLTDDVLPASPKPNPLLPLAVLRAAGAPRATPERERQWAETLYAALCTCAAEIIVSHAHTEGERELRPSPLIADLPETGWRPGLAAADAVLPQQSLDDERGPPLPAPAGDGPAAGARGGLDVLDTQARNPLWAFVRHRLGGRAMEDYAEASAMSVRGQFLHGALEQVWRMVPDQERLHELIAEGRLAALVDQAIAQSAGQTLNDYPEALRTLECARAATVLGNWLDVEAQRTPFGIDQVEGEHTWSRGALTLKVRLDRMDRLPDGRGVIVDYKTGMSPGNPESDWSRARPVNLQLPFYAAVLSGEQPEAGVAALVLAQIHARQVAAQGLTDADLGLEGMTAAEASKAFEGQTWTGILARWRGAIEGLADEYASGYAANFAARPDDLKYCDAMPFLRLNLEAEDEA